MGFVVANQAQGGGSFGYGGVDGSEDAVVVKQAA